MACMPNQAHTQSCCPEGVSLRVSDFGLGHGRKMDFQGWVNSVTISFFFMPLILLGVDTERVTDAPFYFGRNQK